jgi:hypothetical protein
VKGVMDLLEGEAYQEPPRGRRISLKKKPSHHLTGTVKEIRHGAEYGPSDDDPDMAHLVVSHGKRPLKKGEPKDRYREERTTRLHVPKHVAQGLQIGQKVHIKVEPA